MRKVIDFQMKIGATPIEDIKFDLKSRDEIPKLLMGLQHIYKNLDLRREVFNILEEIIPEKIDITNGRSGMDLWKILVLGVLRLNCNWDYDKLKEIADNHNKIREMLGHVKFDNDVYPLQTLKDNIRLFTPEILGKINQVVVKAGHDVIGKKKDETLRGKGDSFVVETDVHFPTDISLLLDAMIKIITLIARLCSDIGIIEWRQSYNNILKLKRLFNRIRKLKFLKLKDENEQAEREKDIINAYEEYINVAQKYIDKAKNTKKIIEEQQFKKSDIEEIEKYIEHAERQIDQIERRAIKGEKIDHSEKVFSIFEEHTEWINKGKIGVLCELGLNVCIIEDQHRFILNHCVMEKTTDKQIVVPFVEATKELFPSLTSCSFDKGFYSGMNKEELGKILDVVIIPKKGKLSVEEKKIENSEDFILQRRKHSAIESAINGLENHGLDICPDHGIEGFERYVALA
ncbi:MAG: ISNCY family transposase, partial [Desulfobacterales bacterium]|nr:ISNCY family transposase [Desulfobacterales bacterium]